MAAFGAARVSTVGGVLTPGISPAQAVITESKGLIARDIQLQAGGTAIPGHDAQPEAAGRYPIVVVISGFTGSSDQNKDVVRRFAQAGYYPIAPELDAREGGMPGKNFQEMSQISSKVTRAQYLGDIRRQASPRWGRGTGTSSAPTPTPPGSTPSAWRAASRHRCSGSMAPPIRGSPPTT